MNQYYCTMGIRIVVNTSNLTFLTEGHLFLSHWLNSRLCERSSSVQFLQPLLPRPTARNMPKMYFLGSVMNFTTPALFLPQSKHCVANTNLPVTAMQLSGGSSKPINAVSPQDRMLYENCAEKQEVLVFGWSGRHVCSGFLLDPRPGPLPVWARKGKKMTTGVEGEGEKGGIPPPH